MKKIILILSFALLIAIQIFGQAAVDINILVHDNAGQFRLLWFGLDLQATDGIDTLLGESNLPPPPPGNAFDARLWLPPFNGALASPKDYRAPGDPPAFPFTGSKVYLLKFQTTDWPITVVWDLPPEIDTSSRIIDPFGGIFINKVFAGTDSAVVFIPVITHLYIFINFVEILPVELTSFTTTVLQNEKAVQLSWSTATETNNSGFEIQRTSPLPSPYQGEGGEAGRGWEKIGFVQGFGTTTEPKSYSFTDENVTTGTYKYRLKQIDYDGTFTYSNEIEVEVDFTPKEFVLYQNYPNPFNPSTTIKYAISNVETHRDASLQMVTLKVYDVLGNEVATLVNEEKQPGVYEVEFDASNLSSGIYFYQLKAGSFSKINKMVLLR